MEDIKNTASDNICLYMAVNQVNKGAVQGGKGGPLPGDGQMMKEGAPVFNLKSAFPYLIDNSFPTPYP